MTPAMNKTLFLISLLAWIVFAIVSQGCASYSSNPHPDLFERADSASRFGAEMTAVCDSATELDMPCDLDYLQDLHIISDMDMLSACGVDTLGCFCVGSWCETGVIFVDSHPEQDKGPTQSHVVLHEYAHAVLYTLGHPSNDHGTTFQTLVKVAKTHLK